MHAHPRSRAEGSRLRRGVVLVLASTVVYGATPALVSLANRSVDLIDLIFYRSLLAAAVLAVLWRILPRRPALSRLTSPGKPIGLRGVCLGAMLYTPHLLLFLGSLQRLDSSLAVAMGYVYPSFVILLVALRSRRLPARSDVVVLVVALLGVVAVAAPGGGAAVDPVGVLMVLSAAALFAIYAVTAAEMVTGLNPIRFGCHLMFGVALSSGVVGVLTGELTVHFGLSTALVLAGQAGLAVAGIVTYTSGLALVGAARASLIDTFQPVVALVAGMSILAERPGPIQYAGVALIIASITLMTLEARRLQPPVVDVI